MVQLPPWVPAPEQVAIPAVVLLSLALARRLDGPSGRWGQRLRARFLLGVPWGTLVSALGVLAVYLFVQQGWSHWRNPVTLPFSSWSYLYPVGWLLGPFSHSGPGHLLGNLTTTLAVAPLAEYFFSHYHTKRGENPFFSKTSNPWIRAFVIFPAGGAVVGLATSLFSWGPIIGFSGVVFAFVGFALVRYPLMTVVAVSAQGAIRTAYHALRKPVIFGSASPSFGEPWWFGIAVQGHVLGLLLGTLLGVAVLYRRRERVGALRLWTGAVVLGMSMSLWALWWYRGESTYVLYRGAGVVFVVALAALTTVAATADRRPIVGDVSQQQVGLLALLLPLAVMVGVAVPVNLTTVGDASVPGGGPAVEVQGYNVTYAEEVQNQKVSAIDVSLFGETTDVTTSGVIVVNDDREIWATTASKGRLAFTGRVNVRVGGVGWSEVVTVQRRGWSAVGGGTAYQVWLRGPDDGNWTKTFASDPAVAEATLANRSVAVVPGSDQFALHVMRNNSTVASGPIPASGEDVTLDDLRFEREGRKLYAAFEGTRVRVAVREEYN
ncbi:rhomboid family intramembrane serine protease [Halorussus ruber]|uniref:rhomboid family intramembrane serine protease n=1 Tax=Halorussus ruber TaxID=1126238 RepID=UPI001091DDE8|nr:rhomboid family intramembrane serine protease [Halorussus ruber]